MYVGQFVFMDIDAHQSLPEDGVILRGSSDLDLPDFIPGFRKQC